MSKFEIGDLVRRKKNKSYAYKVVEFINERTIKIKELGFSDIITHWDENELESLPITREIILEKWKK
jgi:hypothetical protein